MAANLLAQSGVLNILVNNASILSNATIATSPKQKWRRVQDVNVDASFILAHSFLPRMRAARWCGVINMFSSAAKSGGLTVVTFYPGPKSAMRDDLLPRSRSSGKDRHIQRCSARQCGVTNGFRAAPRGAQLAANLAGCFCEPEEVAHALKVFASRFAGFIASEVIDPNGGLHND
jgi:3-oxoacyl-[acyl-carrier protein] reductase